MPDGQSLFQFYPYFYFSIDKKLILSNEKIDNKFKLKLRLRQFCILLKNANLELDANEVGC